MVLAGDITYADDIVDVEDASFNLLAQTTITADSSTWNSTTVVSLATVTTNIISGENYEIRYMSGNVSSTVTTDLNLLELREDTTTGNRLSIAQMAINNTTTVGLSVNFVAKLTASSTGAKTFVLGGARVSGTGVAQLRHAGSRAGYLQFWHLNS